MTQLTLAKAQTIIEEGFKRGATLKLKPLAIAVLDAGGHLKAFAAADETSLLRPQIAHGKAFGALALGMGSRALNAMAADRPHFLQALNGAAGGTIVPVPGGVLVRDGAGAIIGAVGVTGDTSDNDEACAFAGIEAAGFKPDGG